MFITKAKLESLEDRIKKLEDNYWFLAQANDRLLTHLGLSEIYVSARTELRIKCSAGIPIPVPVAAGVARDQ